jgi:ABC-2 type transport system permease protein
MSKIGILLRAGFKSNFGLVVLRHSILREKKDRWLLPLLGLTLLGVLPAFYGYVLLLRNGYFLLKPIGQERVLLTLGLLSGQILILIFGVYFVISAFYFSRDLDILIPLPVKPSEVMGSKFTIILVNEYLTVAWIVLPVIFAFGVMDSSGIGYWANAGLVYLALPILPLAVVSMMVVVMMRFVNITRKKDTFILIGSILLLAVAFGFPILMRYAESTNVGTQDFVAFLSSPNSLLNIIGAWFPPNLWATRAIAGGFSGEGLINLSKFLGTSLLFLIAMIALAQKLFYAGAIGLGETNARRRLLTRDGMSRRLSSGRRAIAAIFIREWRIMNRTPVFFLNGVLVVLIIPVFYVFMAESSPETYGALFRNFFVSGDSLALILSLALFMTVCGCINGTASSTFSREGAQFWISKVIPVSPPEQVAAKFLHSYLIGNLGIATAAIVAGVVLQLKASILLAALGLALAANILLTAVGMIIDSSRPLLDWTNPQKAIKQNLNVLLAIFADIGILTAVYFSVKTLIKLDLPGNTIIGLLYGALIVGAALSYRALLKFAEKRYAEIER